MGQLHTTTLAACDFAILFPTSTGQPKVVFARKRVLREHSAFFAKLLKHESDIDAYRVLDPNLDAADVRAVIDWMDHHELLATWPAQRLERRLAVARRLQVTQLSVAITALLRGE